MALSEAERTDLYTGLVEVFGPARAEIMMTAYKMHDLDEVATKGDISLVRQEVSALTAAVDRIDTKLDRLIFILIAGLFGIIATLIGVGLLN